MDSDVKTEKKDFWNTCHFGLFPAKYFIPMFIITAVGVMTGSSAVGFLGAFATCTLLGNLLDRIGEETPIVRSYLGGGSIVALFGTALVAYLNLLPASGVKIMNDFVKSYDYNGLVVGGLICGSILSMDRKLLIKAGALYFIPLLSGIVFAFACAGLVGQLLGYGWRPSILFVALPIMGGGTAAGAVPTAATYANVLTKDNAYYLSLLMPAVVMGNALAIVSAGILKGVGERFPKYSGNGVIFRTGDLSVAAGARPGMIYTVEKLGRGFIISAIFFTVGILLSKVFPIFHYYAWTIIGCAACKIFGFFPKDLEEDVYQWYQFISKVCIPAILVSIGFVYTDLGLVVSSFNVTYVLLVVATVLGCIAGTWLIGGLIGFYQIEIALTAGLCMANMGGSGDVATLGAAGRMELMPFAQISSRLGGALIIIIASLVSPLIGQGL